MGSLEYNEYMRVYMNKRYAERNQRALEVLGSKCWVCGSTDELEFDHIDPKTKSFGIKYASQNWDLILEELKKCQLLCHDCHVEKSKEDQKVWNAENGRTCACSREFPTFPQYRGHRRWCHVIGQ